MIASIGLLSLVTSNYWILIYLHDPSINCHCSVSVIDTSNQVGWSRKYIAASAGFSWSIDNRTPYQMKRTPKVPTTHYSAGLLIWVKETIVGRRMWDYSQSYDPLCKEFQQTCVLSHPPVTRLALFVFHEVGDNAGWASLSLWFVHRYSQNKVAENLINHVVLKCTEYNMIY